MKRSVIITSILLSLLFSKGEVVFAQSVIIQDTAFASYLRFIVPSAMNGNQMDTSSSAIKHLTSIQLPIYNNISNLNGIQYFTNLDTLNCNISTHLSFLPLLPNKLSYLSCVNCSLMALPVLPNSLKQLICGGNLFTNLPTLPDSLLKLWCSGGALTSLPTLPNSIQQINCSSNSLTSLPKLPNSLTFLWCAVNQLTSLPALPNSLQYLLCDKNQLTSLPALPNSLLALGCQNNKIVCFPPFPNSLATNSLSLVPTINISGNPFTCLPNYVTTLPNYSTAMDATTLAYPLCNLDNSNGCPTSTDVPTAIIIPNIFTPNGDNINDTFFIKASNLTNFSCKIYNRWGVLVYQFTDINSSWNGKDKNGENCTDGTYYYFVSYTDNTNKANTKNGFFQLTK